MNEENKKLEDEIVDVEEVIEEEIMEKEVEEEASAEDENSKLQNDYNKLKDDIIEYFNTKLKGKSYVLKLATQNFIHQENCHSFKL